MSSFQWNDVYCGFEKICIFNKCGILFLVHCCRLSHLMGTICAYCASSKRHIVYSWNSRTYEEKDVFRT